MPAHLLAGGFGDLSAEPFCYLTTRGRNTGRPHTIEIWFGVSADRIYMLSGGGRRADWVRNLIAHPNVTVRISEREWPGKASVVDNAEEEAMARRLLASKYQGWREGRSLSGWASTALPVVIQVQHDPGTEIER